MRNTSGIGSLDPIDPFRVHEAMVDPVFDELSEAIVAMPRGSDGHDDDPVVRISGPRRSLNRVSVALVAAAAATVLVLGLLALGGVAKPRVPSQVAPTAGDSTSGTHLRQGTWQTLDASVKGDWRQNTSGPPGGTLSCPTATICYQMAGHFPSAMAGAPLLYESLSATRDAGTTWAAYRMPGGFEPTSPISCGGPSSCAAGGNYDGHSVLVSTDDGGRSFTTFPLPTDVGAFVTLDCTEAHVCSGLAASRLYVAGNSGATFLTTADGGSTFTDRPIVAGDSMEALSCSSRLDCTAVGTSDALGVNNVTAGVAARTTDGGHTWSPGALPGGFGISQDSELSCADARHCSVTGNIAIHVANPPACAGIPNFGGVTTTTGPQSAPDPAVQAIAQAESQVASAANLKSATSGSGGGFTCNPGGTTTIGDVASTTNGGITWSPNALPDNIPQPFFTGISCPTANECWASGSGADPQTVGNSSNGGSSMLLGTTDGGKSWSPVSFSVPEGAPNYDGQSYLSLGFITCPASDACFANGATAQGSPTAPFYTLTRSSHGL